MPTMVNILIIITSILLIKLGIAVGLFFHVFSPLILTTTQWDRYLLLSSFFRRGKWRTETLSHFLNITQLISCGPRLELGSNPKSMILTTVTTPFFLHSGSHSIKGWEFVILSLAKGMMGVVGSVLQFSKKPQSFWNMKGSGDGVKFCIVKSIVFWLFVKLRWSLKIQVRLPVEVKKLERGQGCWPKAQPLVTPPVAVCIYIALPLGSEDDSAEAASSQAKVPTVSRI